MQTMKTQNAERTVIPIFYSCDSRYLPYLSVSIASLCAHVSHTCDYRIYILHDGMEAENAARIRELEQPDVSIQFVNVAERIKPLLSRLSLRDYYTVSIYFRLFIPAMFPEYETAIYLDADTVLQRDIAELYRIPLGSSLLGAVPDAIMASYRVFAEYAEQAVGVPYRTYFNSGVLLMNLERLRAFRLEERFAFLLRRYHFETICPDQDYLNVLCRGRVRLLDTAWNRMPIDRESEGEPYLVHFNMFEKPWLYHGVAHEELFWRYARNSSFLPQIEQTRDAFGLLDRLHNRVACWALMRHAAMISMADENFRSVLVDRDAGAVAEPMLSLDDGDFAEGENAYEAWYDDGTVFGQA